MALDSISGSGAFAAVSREQRRWSRVQAIRDYLGSCQLTSGSRITDGPVQLEGRVVPCASLRAPVRGRPVVGYRLRLEGEEPVRPASPARALLLDVSLMNDFDLALADGGMVRVQASLACLPLLQPEPVEVMGLEELMRPEHAAILSNHPVPASEVVNYGRYLATEFLLEPGETAFVYGVAQREVLAALPTAMYREPPSRLQLLAPPGGVLVIADQPRQALLQALDGTDRMMVDGLPVQDH